MIADAGVQALRAACARHDIDLSVLVAETALWVHPDVHHELIARTGSAAVYPDIRRARMGSGERPGTITSTGVRLDRNNYAGTALRRWIGLSKQQLTGYHACHVWPLTCYDERYHTVLANLVLIPQALAGLSDFDPEVMAALQFRAFELFGWHPAELPAPVRPSRYPEVWLEPARPGSRARTNTQKQLLVALYREHGGNRRAVVETYARAERDGRIHRRSNTRATSPEEYATRLFSHALAKGWFDE